MPLWLASGLAKLVARPLLMLALCGGLVLVGFGGGLAFDRRPKATHWPLTWLGDSLAVRLEAQRARAVKAEGLNLAWKIAVLGPKGWKAYSTTLEGRLKTARDKAATSINTGFVARQSGNSDAYDQAFAFGRIAGLKACGAPHASNIPSRRLPAAGGVLDHADDLAADWGASAYRAPGPVRPGH